MKKLRSDSPIHSNGPGHFMHIAPDLLTKIGNLVNERNLGGQKSVGGIFNQFRPFKGGDHKWSLNQIKRSVKIAHDLYCPLIVSANNHAIRSHKVTNRGAFPEKLRIRDYAEVNWP